MSDGLKREQAKAKLENQDQRMIFEILVQNGVIVDNVKRADIAKRIDRWYKGQKK
jgi:hypothetical protein